MRKRACRHCKTVFDVERRADGKLWPIVHTFGGYGGGNPCPGAPHDGRAGARRRQRRKARAKLEPR